jgi:2-polyprenyl-3-methyl-5-hydroxy-6-metoxy-1,4-benzoquinol methylase
MNIITPSPITGGKTKKVGEIPTKLIKKNIKKQFGLDMSDVFKDLSFTSILECEDTGYKFYYPSLHIDEEAYYNKVGRTKGYYSPLRWEFHLALDFINPQDKVCEIGSGYGAFLDILKENHINCQGIELNTNAVEVLTKKGHSASNSLIQDFCKTHAEEFDVVCFFQVLEHIHDVDAFMKSVLRCVNGGGKILIAVPNNDAFVMKYDYLRGAGNIPPHHTGLWGKESLINMGKYYGLKLLNVIEQPLPAHLAGYYYSLKVKKKFGALASIIVPATRWFVKIFLKKIAHDISGPYVFVAFEK